MSHLICWEILETLVAASRKEIQMKSKMVIYVTQIIVVFLLSVCTNSQATVKYQKGDKNVEAGQTLQWSFDSDPVGGLPAGTHAFSGKWELRAEADAPSRPNVLCQTGTEQYPALSFDDKIFTEIRSACSWQ
jgi:hypothetical protein